LEQNLEAPLQVFMSRFIVGYLFAVLKSKKKFL